MALTRGEIKGQVLRLLMKSSEFPGFYTDDKINDALHEAMDVVAVEMFMAGEGWTDKIEYKDTVANQTTIPITTSYAMIKEVRYKFGDVYLPLTYDTMPKQMQYADDSGARQWASTYRIVDNRFYFNPPLAEGGAAFLQIEYCDFPKRLQTDTDFLESQFNFAFSHYIKYGTASVLAASIEKFAVSWKDREKFWYNKMRDIVVKRNAQSTAIREFQG